MFFVVNFEHISQLVLVFLSLTYEKERLTEKFVHTIRKLWAKCKKLQK